MAKAGTGNRIYGLALGGAAVLLTAGYFVAVLALPDVVNPGSTAGYHVFLS